MIALRTNWLTIFSRFWGTLDGVRDIDRDDQSGKDEVALQLNYARVFYHYDGERAITVDAGVLRYKTTPLEVTNAIKNRFNPDQDYPGLILSFGGEAQETQNSLIELALTFIIAALGIYFLLVLLFNSLLQPLLVILSIPFGVSGVIFAFGLHDRPLSFLAAIGMIGMAGVVVNDSLVLVNHLNQLTRRGSLSKMRMKVLIASGVADRLRPVLLTTLTTVAGLLPLAYGIGGEDTSMGPMAFALGYGLLFATPLTLVLLPSLYMIGYDLKTAFQKVKETFSDDRETEIRASGQ